MTCGMTRKGSGTTTGTTLFLTPWEPPPGTTQANPTKTPEYQAGTTPRNHREPLTSVPVPTGWVPYQGTTPQGPGSLEQR